MPEDRRRLGPPPALSHLRPRRLLRLVEEQARDEALSRDETPDRQVVRARRGLALVLRRRDLPGARVVTAAAWPEIPLAAWAETRDTLHLWTQIVGKVRLVKTPFINHSWHATYYVTPRGLTTSLVPHGERLFGMEFDFLEHRLAIQTVDGDRRVIPLVPKSVATFYREVLATLDELGLPVEIHTHPAEIAGGIPFPEDETHRSYDSEYAQRFWRALATSHRVLQKFRSTFVGKASPVHFFWGSFDLALTLFSGRPATPLDFAQPHMPKWVVREASTQEQAAFGFWPGTVGTPFPEAAFYAYAHPAPDGFAKIKPRSAAASFPEAMGEWILPYDAVRTAKDPDRELLSFLEDTYGAVADLAKWDKALVRI